MEWFWYRENEKNEIILLRMFGSLPEVVVPEHIGGKPVTGLSMYCFSEKGKVTGKEDFLQMAAAVSGDSGKWDFVRNLDVSFFFLELKEKKIRALSGDYITRVFLPDTIQTIGNLSFYQCRNLKAISLGAGELELGSDAFMNCKKLDVFVFRASAEKVTGLRQILLQRSGETSAFFRPGDSVVSAFSRGQTDEETEAAVFFPEYVEAYDLIGPAHIFELNIEGEGFRARQCFEDGVFQFAKYDQIFPQACDTEEESALCKMAAYRLRYPKDLKEEAEELYRTYLLRHIGTFIDELIRDKSLELIESLGKKGYFTGENLELCIQKMVEKHWTEGTRKLLEWKKEWQQEREGEVYAFEDF